MSADTPKPSPSQSFRGSRLQVSTAIFQIVKIWAEYIGKEPDLAAEELIIEALQAKQVDLNSLRGIYAKHQKNYREEVDAVVKRMRGTPTDRDDDQISMQ